MAWGAVAGAAVGLIGSQMSGAGNATTTNQNQIDPRLVPYLYGNGAGGLMGSVNGLYQQQLASGGLNPMQTAGLEMQRQTLMDPAYTQGYAQMRDLGSSLMVGVAGNPFGNTVSPSGPNVPSPTMPPRATALGFPSAAVQPVMPGSAPQMTAPAGGPMPSMLTQPGQRGNSGLDQTYWIA